MSNYDNVKNQSNQIFYFPDAGVNMGYMENSYSNSNNGGSVNSQDSIWQMKSAAAANGGVGMNPPNVVIGSNGVGGVVVGTPYDMGGYGTTESDYPTHQHYLPQRDDYRESHNLSRQQFCEPFATVVKSQSE